MNETIPPLPTEVVQKIMQLDLFSKWLGIEVLDIGNGYCKIKMTVREEMVNGLGIVHGGICFSLADTCFGYACNSHNQVSVALDNAINYVKPVFPGDVLVAESREIHYGRSTGLYHVTITNQAGHMVAVFKGTCVHSGKTIL